MQLIINKIREVKTPDRGTPQSAGLDFYLPKINQRFIHDFLKKNPKCSQTMNFADDDKVLVIPPRTRVCIPSGIKTYMDPGTALIAENKSGLSTKKGLIVTATTIDSDYTGEIHLGLYNSDPYEAAEFKEGDKVLQFIHHNVYLSEVLEVTSDTFERLHLDSERGANGFGSTSRR